MVDKIETDNSDTYTRWSLIASGQGGGRIATEFLTRESNPGFKNRISVMNTARPDLRNTIRRMKERSGVTVDLQSDQETLPMGFTFGPQDGAGNDFAAGEMCATEGFDDQILSRFQAAGLFADSDVFLYVTALGGGTGNGSVPYIIKQLKKNPPTGAETVGAHIAVAAWPYDNESEIQEFNAVCGLSRLLRWYDGEPNADMVLLIDNECVVSQAGERRNNDFVNRKIRDALDLMIAAGRETYDVIDARDYIQRPKQKKAYHHAPAVATEMDTLYHLEKMFDKAADNTFVRMDPTTSRTLFTIVRAPRHLIDTDNYGGRDTFTSEEITGRLNNWLENNGYDQLEFTNTTLTPVDRHQDQLDILFLFGGFDLDPLVGDFLTNVYEDHIPAEGTSYLDTQTYHKIKRNLQEYMDENRP